MTRVGWVVDQPGYVGGAEMTAAEFRTAAPDGVEIIDCTPGSIPDADVYAVHNCVTYSPADVRTILRCPTVKFWHDVGSFLNPEVRMMLDALAVPVCCSPLQAEYMSLDAHLIPPAVNLTPFLRAGDRSNGHRRGAVSVGSWRNPGKGGHRILEWAEQHVPVDSYGPGLFAPPGSRPVDHDTIPALLAKYQTFVFLPAVIEPFGRCVVEAWAAGLDLIVNDLVGAKYWVQDAPDSLGTAAADFWKIVLA